MRLDCTRYKMALDKLKSRMEGEREPSRLMTRLSTSTQIPVMAVCVYMLTYTHPKHPDLLRSYAGLRQFYNYTEIVPFLSLDETV